MFYEIRYGCFGFGKLFNRKIDGVYKGIFSVFTRKKKVVVGAFNHYIPDFWSLDIFYQWFSSCAFYLYFILMNREKALETIIVLALVSLIVHLWLDIYWLTYLSIGFLALSIISKWMTIMIGKGWFAFSYYLGVIMNYIIMFIIFYLFLVPLSFFQRLAGSNQILKKRDSKSHFHQRNHLFTQKDIEKPW